jgi:Kdo2-lipid IVA lauroyltransferase/acyltransferase
MNRLFGHAGIGLMRCLAFLPLSWVRGLGSGLGWLLWVVVASRRKVVRANLSLCFRELPVGTLRALERDSFKYFAQAWLDRSWLWHGRPSAVRPRLRVQGDGASMAMLAESGRGLVLFAPHFVGLDAGWTALAERFERSFSTIYSHQSNQMVDAWVLAGRGRFGQVALFDRAAGPKPVIRTLQTGSALYLLPDMNYGLPESVFVPFFGHPAATVTSLSRLAKLGRAPLIPIVTTLTPEGYNIDVLPAWDDVPSADLTRDTAAMNTRLEGYITRDRMAHAAQYYWVHKRFKDLPAGVPAVY